MASQHRIHLGKVVRAAWVKWARNQRDPKPSWLLDWSEIDDGQREVDMQIGEAVAADVRQRLFSQPVTQRFELDDCILHCAGCHAELTDSRMVHAPGCSEIMLGALLGEAR